MIAVDTNVLVRFLTRDDEAQFKKAVKLFKEPRLFVSESVLLETEWVLRYAYEFSPDAVVQAFRKLLGLPQVVVGNAQKMKRIIDWHEQGLDFADAMHLANGESGGCSELVTFDKKFVKQAKERGECVVRAV